MIIASSYDGNTRLCFKQHPLVFVPQLVGSAFMVGVLLALLVKVWSATGSLSTPLMPSWQMTALLLGSLLVLPSLAYALYHVLCWRVFLLTIQPYRNQISIDELQAWQVQHTAYYLEGCTIRVVQHPLDMVLNTGTIVITTPSSSTSYPMLANLKELRTYLHDQNS